MPVTIDAIKELRGRTGAGFIDVKRALEASAGDLTAAEAALYERGLAVAANKASRSTTQGRVETYVHDGRIGAMVEVNCETDFVARTEEFRTLAREVAMQVAAMNPKYIAVDEVPADKAGDVKELALLAQSYIREPSQTVQDLVTNTVLKVGENVRVSRFARYELGQP